MVFPGADRLRRGTNSKRAGLNELIIQSRSLQMHHPSSHQKNPPGVRTFLPDERSWQERVGASCRGVFAGLAALY